MLRVNKDTDTVPNLEALQVRTVAPSHLCSVVKDTVSGDNPRFPLEPEKSHRQVEFVWREASDTKSQA